MGKERKRRSSSRDYQIPTAEKKEPKPKKKKKGKVPVHKPPKIARSKIPRNNDAGKIQYPPRDGFRGAIRLKKLERDTYVDRYGYNGGYFVSPVHTPYGARSLPQGTDKKRPYKVFRVLKRIEVEVGKAAAAFGEKGGGIQYKFGKPISELITHGFLKEISST